MHSCVEKHCGYFTFVLYLRTELLYQITLQFCITSYMARKPADVIYTLTRTLDQLWIMSKTGNKIKLLWPESLL